MPKFSEHSKSVFKMVGGYYSFVAVLVLGVRAGSALATRVVG